MIDFSRCPSGWVIYSGGKKNRRTACVFTDRLQKTIVRDFLHLLRINNNNNNNNNLKKSKL